MSTINLPLSGIHDARYAYRMSEKSLTPLAQRIQKRIDVMGTSVRAISKRVGSEALVQNIIAGKSKSPRAENLESIARELNTTTRWLLTGEGDEDAGAALGSVTHPTGFSPVIIPGRDLVGDRNFPVYAAARASSEGHQIVTFDAIDYVKRPAMLENVKDAYGLYIVGDSMFPAYEQGDMALVHPHLPPARDKNVVLYHLPPFGQAEAEAMVKRLLRFDDRDWQLRQFNPPAGEDQDFTVTRADWKICHRIVGKYEAR